MVTVPHGVRAFLAAGVLAASGVACNAILGIGDVPLPPDAGGGVILPGLLDAGDATMSTVADAGQPAVEAASGCVDTQMDTHNCGNCGHDCLGGQCSLGICQPVALTAGDAGVSPWDLAQDDSYLYWTDLVNGAISRTSKSGAATALLSSLPGSQPRGIAVDDSAVYWGDLSGIERCSKTTCNSAPVLAAKAQTGAVASLSVDDAHVYWGEEGSQIYAANKYSSAGEMGSVLWEGDASTNLVTTDGVRVYFSASDGDLRGVGVDGGGPFALNTGGNFTSEGIALSGGSVYWAMTNEDFSNPMGGYIAGASTAALAPGPVASMQRNPYGVATDGTTLYWTNLPSTPTPSGQIASCTISQCSAAVIAGGYSNPHAIVVDATAVYWTDSGSGAVGMSNGTIWKLAK